MYTITKTFSWIYGHRLHKQNVPPCLCRNLHGHSSKISLSFEGELKNGMILDFNMIKVFKNEFEKFYDHKMLICKDDPLLQSWMDKYELEGDELVDYGYESWAVKSWLEGVEEEFFGSLVIVEFEPTSENLSRWILQYVNSWLGKHELGGRCWKVELWETESSCGVYQLMNHDGVYQL